MIKEGTLVEVYIPETDTGISMTRILAKRFNGKRFRVTKAKSIKDRNGRACGSYYELEGAESDKGIPYSFEKTWIHTIEKRTKYNEHKFE